MSAFSGLAVTSPASGCAIPGAVASPPEDSRVGEPDTLAVVVAPRHIERGNRGDTRTCAVALALIEAGYRHVVVGCTTANVDDQRWQMPPEMVQFVLDFDKWLPVYPDRYVLTRIR